MASNKKSDSDGEDKPKPIIIRNTTDLQRLKLEKLMQNPVSSSKHIPVFIILFIFYFRINQLLYQSVLKKEVCLQFQILLEM